MITNLEGKSRVVDIANLSGSVGGAVGGTLTVAGLALIPFTFGASVALTVSGLGLSVVGAVTSGGALITNITVDVNSRKDFDNLIAIDCSATARMQDRLRELQDVAAQFTTWTSRSPGFVVTDKVMHTLRATKSLVGCGRGINSGIKNVCMASKVACAATESAKEGVRLSKTGVAGAKAASTFAGAAVESATEGVTLCKTGDIGAKLASAGVKTVSKATMGLAAVGVAADIAMIAYFSHRIYTGSKSSRAAEIRRIRRLLKGELSTLQDVHNTLVEHWPAFKFKMLYLDAFVVHLMYAIICAPQVRHVWGAFNIRHYIYTTIEMVNRGGRHITFITANFEVTLSGSYHYLYHWQLK